MNRRPRRLRYAGLIMAGTVAILFGSRQAGAPMFALWEYGISMPTGIYVFHHFPPAQRGEVIVMEKAERWSRPYLMKRVEGVEGDVFCWDPERQQHRINGRWMPGPSPLAADLGLSGWEGCRALRPGEYVGYGDHPESYDSRYLGPINEAQIAGVYRLVLPLRGPSPAR